MNYDSNVKKSLINFDSDLLWNGKTLKTSIIRSSWSPWFTWHSISLIICTTVFKASFASHSTSSSFMMIQPFLLPSFFLILKETRSLSVSLAGLGFLEIKE